MMVTFIAARIEEANEISLAAGQEKYRAYFINTTRYAAWKADVDAILVQDGFGDVIVTA